MMALGEPDGIAHLIDLMASQVIGEIDHIIAVS